MTTLSLAPAEPDTIDSLQLFLNQASKYPLLTAAEEIELAKRIERGDMEAKDRMINSNLRREVRLASRLQVLDLRHPVDPAGDPARPRQHGAADPAARERRRP
jgi:DNA-directed RNA polymerase sigma subunit (sigma70/sigma32)